MSLGFPLLNVLAKMKRSRGLMNGSSGKGGDYTNIDETQIDLKKEDTLRFTLGGSKSRKNPRHGTKETISVAKNRPNFINITGLVIWSRH